MNTTSKGVWRRAEGAGCQSVWSYAIGPRFCVEMLCERDSRLMFWCEDGNLRDMNHWQKGPWVRRWIVLCWRQHLADLTGHERMEYVVMGLIQETD